MGTGARSRTTSTSPLTATDRRHHRIGPDSTKRVGSTDVGWSSYFAIPQVFRSGRRPRSATLPRRARSQYSTSFSANRCHRPWSARIQRNADDGRHQPTVGAPDETERWLSARDDTLYHRLQAGARASRQAMRRNNRNSYVHEVLAYSTLQTPTRPRPRLAAFCQSRDGP